MYHGIPLYSYCIEKLISTLCLSDYSSRNQTILDAQLSLTERFIELGVDFNKQDQLGRTCLVLVISHTDYFPQPKRVLYDIVKLMLDHGAQVAIQDNQGNDALKHAVLKAFRVEGIKKLLESVDNQLEMLTCLNKKGLSVIDMTSDSAVKRFLENKLSDLKKPVENNPLDSRTKVNEFFERHTSMDFD